MLTVAAFLIIGLLAVAACEVTRVQFVRLLAGERPTACAPRRIDLRGPS